MKKKKTFLIPILLILMLCMCVCVYVGLVNNTEDDNTELYKKIEEEAGTQYDTSQQQVIQLVEADTVYSETDADTDVQNTVIKDEYFTKANKNISLLKEKYPDVIGWMYMPSANINYPLVESEGEEYLRKNIEGNKSNSGTIFCFNTQTVSPYENMDKNIVFYGHNLKNCTMFTYVNYLRVHPEALYKENGNLLYFDTLDATYTFRVFAVYEAEKGSWYTQTQFANENDFISYCNKAMSKSVYDGYKHTFTNDDKIITLSTCSSRNTKLYRSVINAVLVNVNKK